MLLKHVAALLLVLLAATARGDGYDSIAGGFAVAGDEAWFAAVNELWTTDGTPAGTRQVSDFGDGAIVQSPFVANGQVFFFLRREGMLSVYDRHLQEVAPVGDFVVRQVASGARVTYFTTTSPAPDWEERALLWRTDGTPAGTRMVTVLPDRDAEDLFVEGELLFFELNGLWRSDGTLAGTFRLVDVIWDSVRHAPGLGVFFRRETALWFSDGTPAGTRLLREDYDNPESIAVLNGVAFIGTNRRNLLRSDGTVAGTEVVRSFQGTPQNLTVFRDRVYFTPYPTKELWSTDGTAAGTRRESEHEQSSWHRETEVAGPWLHYSEWETLWRTDGTAKTLLGRFHITSYDQWTPRALTALGERVLFAASDGVHGIEPWITTAGGVQMLGNLAPEAEVSGRVTDAHSGQPVRARVTLTREDVWFSVHADTGEDGRYAFEGLLEGVSYRLHVRTLSDTHVAQSRELVPNARVRFAGFDFALLPAARIAGRVVDPTGRPAAGVRVHAVNGRHPAASAITDANGAYVIDDALAPGDWFVFTSSDTYSRVLYDGIACHAGCALWTGKPVPAASGATTEGIDFVVTPYGSVSGRLLDAVTGEPIAQGVLTVKTLGGDGFYHFQRHTIAGGEYSIRLPDGQSTLTAEAPLYGPGAYPSAITAVPGKTAGGYDIHLTPLGGRVSGRVIDAATGAPLAKIQVRVLDARGHLVTWTLTKADGTYETPPAIERSGTYRVEAAPHELYEGARVDGVRVEGNGVARGVDFALQRFAALEGVVVDAKTRLPLRGARVTIAGGTIRRTIATDEEGRYRERSLPPATYVVTAEKRGWTTAAASVGVPVRGETARADFALPPACDVSVSPPGLGIGRDGGVSVLEVAAPCTVCSFPGAGFIQLLHGACSSKVTVFVEPNYAEARQGTVVFPGTFVTIAQESRWDLTTSATAPP